MAKIRVMSNQRRVGRVGDTTYYVRDGEQIARQSRNNSNYGESASRSESQQRRRIKWANLVNFYKACSFWMPKAFENVKQGQTMYNKFMSLNVNDTVVALTKDMAQSGCAVVEKFQVAKGSLPLIELGRGDANANIATSIVITSAISATTTVGDLAADIIANNEEFLAGDNLAIISFTSFLDGQGYPYSRSIYKEITLTPSSTDLLTTILPSGSLAKTEDGHLGLDDGNVDYPLRMVAVIHTRSDRGALKVSSSFVYYEYNDMVEQFSGEQWYQECIASYGVDGKVLLYPSFSEAPVSRVTANGEPIKNADVLTGSQIIRVYGNNSKPSGYKFVCNGVEYTPLAAGDDYDEYVLSSNGHTVISTDIGVYMSFSVQGITIPAEMTGKVIGSLVSINSTVKPGSTVESQTGVVNVPYQLDETYSRLRVTIFYTEGESISDRDISVVNGVGVNFDDVPSQSCVVFTARVTDLQQPIIVYYKSMIVAVGNY